MEKVSKGLDRNNSGRARIPEQQDYLLETQRDFKVATNDTLGFTLQIFRGHALLTWGPGS